jgi:dCMP deaminase
MVSWATAMSDDSFEIICSTLKRREISRQEKWDRRYLEMARFVGDRWSKDPSTKVGAVLVDDLGRVIPGYNGFPRGLDDSPATYADRDAKLQRVIHAEMNAILNAGSARGMTLYVSAFPPCSRCAAHVIQAGIKRVVYENRGILPDRWRSDMHSAVMMLREAGIEVESFKL